MNITEIWNYTNSNISEKSANWSIPLEFVKNHYSLYPIFKYGSLITFGLCSFGVLLGNNFCSNFYYFKLFKEVVQVLNLAY